MDEQLSRKQPDHHAPLVRLWTRAQDWQDYVKADWRALETAIVNDVNVIRDALIDELHAHTRTLKMFACMTSYANALERKHAALRAETRVWRNTIDALTAPTDGAPNEQELSLWYEADEPPAQLQPLTE